jgi:homocysteine S-methyltransferase
MVANDPQVIAVGANCFPPRLAPAIVANLRREGAGSVIVYPNAGETWDSATRRWVGRAEEPTFIECMTEAVAAGAAIVGGCCRTTPADILALRTRLQSEGSPGVPSS